MSETPPHPTGGDKIDAPGSPGLVNRPAGDVHQNFIKHYYGPKIAHDRKNRQRMLSAVRDFWVKGVLEQSLYQEVLIAPGLHTNPQAIHSQTIYYKGMRLSRDAVQESYALPPGTTNNAGFLRTPSTSACSFPRLRHRTHLPAEGGQQLHFCSPHVAGTLCRAAPRPVVRAGGAYICTGGMIYTLE